MRTRSTTIVAPCFPHACGRDDDKGQLRRRPSPIGWQNFDAILAPTMVLLLMKVRPIAVQVGCAHLLQWKAILSVE